MAGIPNPASRAARPLAPLLAFIGPAVVGLALVALAPLAFATAAGTPPDDAPAGDATAAARCEPGHGAVSDLATARDLVRTQMAYPFGGGAAPGPGADELYAQLLPRARAASSDAEALRVLEAFVYGLADHHAHLGTNDGDSPRLVPTGASVWVESRDGALVVSQVRPGTPARQAGLREGMRIERIDGLPVAQRLVPPASLPGQADAALGFAARVALAGTHRRDAEVVATGAGQTLTVRIGPPESHGDAPATLTWAQPGVARLRLNNSLGDPALPPAFDRLMKSARAARVLVLDLRDTPSGGDSSIAKPLMSWFVRGTRGYQRHQRGEHVWVEQVSGRRHPWRGRLIVLVDHWTGSMGEGLAIGLRDAAGAQLVGTPMAGLRGAIESTPLPCLGAGLRVPVERLFTVDGVPA